MNLEDQCISLEYAKRLKELGVRQKSLYYITSKNNDVVIVYSPNESLNEKWYSAFTVAELGVMLPHSIRNSELYYKKEVIEGKVFEISYHHYNRKGTLIRDMDIVVNAKEADARAIMLIHLIENNYTK